MHKTQKEEYSQNWAPTAWTYTRLRAKQKYKKQPDKFCNQTTTTQIYPPWIKKDGSFDTSTTTTSSKKSQAPPKTKNKSWESFTWGMNQTSVAFSIDLQKNKQ